MHVPRTIEFNRDHNEPAFQVWAALNRRPELVLPMRVDGHPPSPDYSGDPAEPTFHDRDWMRSSTVNVTIPSTLDCGPL
jgi:hypothetical protein